MQTELTGLTALTASCLFLAPVCPLNTENKDSFQTGPTDFTL